MTASIWDTDKTKRLYWQPFDFLTDEKPHDVEYGRRYLCLDIHGNMAVCRWDVTDWCIDVGEFDLCAIRKQMHSEVAAVMCSEYIKAVLPKQAFEAITDNEEFYEFAEEVSAKLYELSSDAPVYFDDVEWYMELPRAPAMHLDSLDGKDIAAEMFDQKMDFIALVESALDAHLRKRRIEDKHDSAPLPTAQP